jgi:adenosylcobinamide-GDP ribazoletransferase
VVSNRGQDELSMSRAPALFPLVGVLVGLAVASIDWALLNVLPGELTAAIAVAAGLIITGAMHLDGLADSADGILGGWDPERRLAIMKDPTLGSFGAAAIICTVLIRWTAITALAGPARFGALALAPVAGRAGALFLLKTFPYARQQGLGERYIQRDVIALVFGHIVTAGMAYVLAGPVGLLIAAIGWIVAISLGYLASRKLDGGLTGDVYGAAIELAEVAVLIAAVAASEADADIIPLWW